MTGEYAHITQLWAELMVEELIRLGLKHVCLAPGSRSTPLTLAVANHPRLSTHVHFDERGLGFMALGIAKATHTPVAVITTSGTAVANLYPAVIEAKQTHQPLLVLSADRPIELVEVGANQAIPQQGIFADYPVWQTQLPEPTERISPAFLLSQLDEAWSKLPNGPVHLNCPFPEPLYPDGQYQSFAAYLQPLTDWTATQRPYIQWHNASPNAAPTGDAWQQFAQRKGVIVVGRIAPDERDAVLALQQMLGWPLLADIQSGLRGAKSALCHADLLIGHPQFAAQLAQAEHLLLIGDRLLSKPLDRALAEHPWQQAWHINAHASQLDPHQRSMQRWVTHCHECVPSQPFASPESGWAEQWYRWDQQCRAQMSAERLSETALPMVLPQWLPPSSVLFLGNSLPVRLFESLAQLNGQHVMTNRGASGIDGLLATAVGASIGADRPVTMVIGDISLLHDLNSLALSKHVTVPLVVIVVNNAGGNIFDFLPVPDIEGVLDHFYRTQHEWHFAAAAQQFGVKYYQPESIAQAHHDYTQAIQQSGLHLMEWIVPPGEARQQMKEWRDVVKQLTLP